MSETNTVPQIGQVVRIVHGREAGQLAIVIRKIDSRFVLLADGDKRRFDSPKRKALRHVELLPYISPEVRISLLEAGRVTNGKLRFAISTYVNHTVKRFEEGR
ncbi:KOW domain-containing RNA-binding protein [Terribacillus sp. DMT04]|uniref:KOW domain-containing RNA-binding protein n=1 Tax=Terribacillus sp. DMT04 TaxID=2850441 RepID=UPI001C2C2804|nr:KOW domain-containing RNA-binding protein [Terribacillus sp. DMT04]QXE01876.1 KOW domain-containing RNA-binding protein [Terribacillus sp. DMT04]